MKNTTGDMITEQNNIILETTNQNNNAASSREKDKIEEEDPLLITGSLQMETSPDLDCHGAESAETKLMDPLSLNSTLPDVTSSDDSKTADQEVQTVN